LIYNAGTLYASMDMSFAGASCNWNAGGYAHCTAPYPSGVQPGFIPNVSMAGKTNVHVALRPTAATLSLYSGQMMTGDVSTGKGDFHFTDAQHCAPYPLVQGQWSYCKIPITEYWPAGAAIPSLFYKVWFSPDGTSQQWDMDQLWLE
jgi:hypothetical protein